MDDNFCYRPDFKYTHDNPYHEKLKIFDSFVLRDDEAEVHAHQWRKVFNNDRPIEVEIGTGYGEFMLSYCKDHPHLNFIGLDHRFKRSFSLAKKLNQLEHRNFRYLRARGERIQFIFGPEEVQNIYYFFPDPWPKKRHHKKRLFQKPFLDACHHILKKNGRVYVKTDHDGYFEWMMKELESEERFEIEIHSRDFRNHYPHHFLTQYKTKFEKIFLSQGVLIKGIVLKKK